MLSRVGIPGGTPCVNSGAGLATARQWLSSYKTVRAQLMNSGYRLILVGGGASSGKSDFALSLARRLGQKRVFLATAQAGDEEMAERIRRHRQGRGADFVTVEEPFQVSATIGILKQHSPRYDVLVLDCLTLWLSNMLCQGMDGSVIGDRVEEMVRALAEATMHAVIVTNEVGLGLIPETPLGRRFREV